MNVTITRARFSLFILGHIRTLRVTCTFLHLFVSTHHKSCCCVFLSAFNDAFLQEQSDWGALIEDARKRKTIIKTMQKDFERDARQILKPERETPTRSLSYPPIGIPSTVTSPVTHAPVETDPAPAPRPQHDMSNAPMPRLIPLECPNNPRMTDRPTDPRFAERRPIREQGPDRDRRGLPESRHSTNRANSYEGDSRSTGQSSRYSSKHSSSSPSRRHRR